MLKLWTALSLAGVKNEMGFETKRRVILLNRIAISLFLIVFTLRTTVIFVGYQDFSFQSLVPYLGIFSILSIIYFNKKGFYKKTAFIFSAISPVCFLFFSVVSQNTINVIHINHYYIPRLFILASVIIPLVLIDSRNTLQIIIAVLINIICILMFDTAVKYIGVPLNPNKLNFAGYESVSLIMILPSFLIVMAFLFLTNLNRKYEKQIIAKNKELEQVNEELLLQKDLITTKHNELELVNEEITCQRDLISEKSNELELANSKIEAINKKLIDSIYYAKDIQHAVMGKEELPENYFNDNFIYFKPQSQVSGDFYYYKEVLINNKHCLLVAAVDCTGHGVPGGFLSMLGITLLNEILQNKNITNAADILNLLRVKIKTALNQTGKLLEQKDGMDMALCIYCKENKELNYAGARMPLCIITKTGELKTIKGDRQPIGVFLKEKAFKNHHIKLNINDMVYIFSDGIQDQFGGSEGKKLKFVNLKNFLSDIAPLPCHEQKEQTKHFLNDWINNYSNTSKEQIDDIVLIGMRV